MDLKPKLKVKISDREKVIFSGEAYAVSSTNSVGPFDVLAQHANYVTTIDTFLDIHLDENNKQHFDIKSGVLRAKLNNVEVFLGI